jgi:hypothetical protein
MPQSILERFLAIADDAFKYSISLQGLKIAIQ